VFGTNGFNGTIFFSKAQTQLHFPVGVRSEAVEGKHNRYTEQTSIFNLLARIGKAFLNQLKVLLKSKECQSGSASHLCVACELHRFYML